MARRILGHLGSGKPLKKRRPGSFVYAKGQTIIEVDPPSQGAQKGHASRTCDSPTPHALCGRRRRRARRK